jgi:hypothetical protein
VLESSFAGEIALNVGAHLYSRQEMLAMLGYVDHDVAQRASVMESYIRHMDHHNQHFPMLVNVGGVGEPQMVAVDPRPQPGEFMTTILAPVRSTMSLVRGEEDIPSVYRYRYHLRGIGDSEQVDLAPPEVRDIIVARRRLMVHMKAKLFLLLLSGQISGAFAASNREESEGNKYVLFMRVLGRLLMVCWDAILRVFFTVLGACNLDWYHNLYPETQAALDICLALTLVGVVFERFVAWATAEPPPLAVTKQTGQNVYLGQVATERGIIHNVRVNGVELRLSSVLESSVCHQDEMAMPGSEYFPCKAQPIGAILVCTGDSELRLFGVFWRMDEFLVTARHCSNTLNQSTAAIYLATIKSTRKGNWEVDRSKLFKTPDDFWSPEGNAIAAYDIDAFAVEVSEKTWSQIRITKASTKVKSAYNQQVHSVGFTPDGLLVSASGKTLTGSGFEHLHHTASTQKGFSGSIILCGNSVVGMHVSAAGEHNVAVRTEMIQYLIDVGAGLEANTKNRKKYTYADASYKEHFRQHKWRGGVAEIKTMRDGKFAIVLRDGEATYGWNMREIVDAFGTGNAAKDEDMFQDMLLGSDFRKKYGSGGGQYVDFDDDRYHDRNDYENASLASERRSRRRPKSTIKRAPPPQKKDMSWLYDVQEGLKPVHGPSAPKVQPEASQLIENHKDEIVALGYVEGEFSFPLMTPQEERLSLENHLEIFGDAVKTVEVEPSEVELERCANIVAELMNANSFVPDEDYNQLSGVLNVIHSSIIGSEKSSGFPYCEQGIPTNGQVLASFGEKGFAQHVLNEWNEDYEFKIFEKGEPTKQKKIAAGRPRIIVGMPLHATVKHASVLKNLAFSLVKNWKKSPIKYAFSPANPGHLEHLKEVLPGRVYESDKETWDFVFQSWIAEVDARVVNKLALRHPNWSEEQLEQYRSDVRLCFEQVFTNSKYRTSDGTLYVMKEKGIMKSGWFGTIAVNSISQVVCNTMTLMRLGLSNEEILALAIVAGGDDVNQDLEGVNLEDYVLESQKLGVKTEIHVREDLEHSEYFSSDIRRGKDGLEFYPKRWTKHIEHLATVKKENLADALCSHMENYRHHAAKFILLENMYHEMRDSDPGLFPLSLLKNRDYLLAKQYGYEHALF